jgi:energy-converting hydrogenase Eha subunit H
MVKSNRFGEQWVSYKRTHTFGRSLSWKSYVRTRTGSVLILLETEHGMRVFVLSCKMIEEKRFASMNHATPTRRIISQEHKLRLTRVMVLFAGITEIFTFMTGGVFNFQLCLQWLPFWAPTVITVVLKRPRKKMFHRLMLFSTLARLRVSGKTFYHYIWHGF